MSRSDPGLISVVIPVYNRERFLPFALESCLQQTYQQLECIVVDDGSTDGSVMLAEEAASKDSRVRVLQMPANRGVAAARNYGVRSSSGAWIAFLDSDDRLTETMLADLIAAAKGLSSSGQTVVWSPYLRVAIEADGSLGEAEEVDPIPDADGDTLLTAYRDWYFTPDAPLHHCSMLFPRKVFERYFYREERAPFTDFELLLRMLLDGVRFEYAAGSGRLLYCQHDSNLTRDKR